MAKLLGHRQTKETDNRQAQPTTTAPLLDSTRFVSSPLSGLQSGTAKSGSWGMRYYSALKKQNPLSRVFRSLLPLER